MKKIYYLMLVLCISAFWAGCKSSEDDVEDITNPEGGEITINGQVVDNTSGNAVYNAVIRLICEGKEIGITTNDQGRFSSKIAISKNSEIGIITIKEGYYTDTVSVFAIAGRTIDVPLIKLQAKTSGSGFSGNPASILLVEQSTPYIGVKESGSVETAAILFEVQDSSGNPIDISHSVFVNFRLAVGPGAGEYLNPASVKTNSLGRASVNLSSGTKSGVVQIEAVINLNGKTIVSKPVNIAIHGGLPDAAHFSVAPVKLNIPGWHIFGVEDDIIAIVGDKYTNPVKPLTSVYFNSTGGVIEGSIQTDQMGTGAVTLISGNPRPVHPLYGNGFATITAHTSDEAYQQISTSCLVLFSGWPEITASPSTFNIPHGGSELFHFTVMDENGNPLSEGAKITVTAEGEKIKLAGDINLSLPDTQSKSWTQFSFFLKDDDAEEPAGTRSVPVLITVSGPNGRAQYEFTGIVN